MGKRLFRSSNNIGKAASLRQGVNPVSALMEKTEYETAWWPWRACPQGALAARRRLCRTALAGCVTLSPEQYQPPGRPCAEYASIT
jgi:hypothetical protein